MQNDSERTERLVSVYGAMMKTPEINCSCHIVKSPSPAWIPPLLLNVASNMLHQTCCINHDEILLEYHLAEAVSENTVD